MSVADNLARVREQIATACTRAGRDPGAVRLIAVAKKQPLEAVRDALAAGQRDVGENYGQELRDKAQALPGGDVTWHFIGPIQSNKVRYVAAHADWVHTVDRPEIAIELARRCASLGRWPRLLVEVNIAREPQKSGVAPEAAAALLAAVAELGLGPLGLMCMPPFGLPIVETARHFAALRGLADDLAKQGLLPASPELSMGMSDDFAEAIAEGATMVRVGTAIFGARQG